MVCKEFGWTYNQFDEQPQHFIDTIVEKMIVDSEEADKVKK
jgi:hypothetical protein